MLSLSGHLGDLTAALVDGQLPAAQEERAWQHVLGCPGCRRAVEEQVAAKQLLGGLSEGRVSAPRREWLGPDALAAWEQVREVERDAAARRRVLALGGGALTVTMVVALALTGLVDAEDVLTPPAPATVRGELVGPVPESVGVAPRWVGTGTGSETSRALWTDGPRW